MLLVIEGYTGKLVRHDTVYAAGDRGQEFVQIQAGNQRAVHFHQGAQPLFFLHQRLARYHILQRKGYEFGHPQEKLHIFRAVRFGLRAAETECPQPVLRSSQRQHAVGAYAACPQFVED